MTRFEDLTSTPYGIAPDAPTQEFRFGPPPPTPARNERDFLPPPPDSPRKKRPGTALAAAGAIVAVALGSGAAGAEFATRRAEDRAPVATSSAAPSIPTPAPPAAASGVQPREQLAQVAAAVQPSVVSIQVRTGFGGGSGSGVILTADGTILTNNHVVESAADGGTLTVQFFDGKTARATIVGRDPGSDLAVIKAQNVSGLTAAKLGDDSKLHVGDTVLALGSPLGLEGSVSAGIVSALHRPVNLGDGRTAGALGDAIQTDAPINPGNSGGALANMSGEVIGINTAIATLGGGFGGQGGSIGLGFAIPITTARDVADQLIRGEQPKPALLGVQVGEAPAGGAMLGSVEPGGAAEKAGLRSGDIITKIGESRISDAASLIAAIRSRRPGSTVEISYTRDGVPATTSATLGAASQS